MSDTRPDVHLPMKNPYTWSQASRIAWTRARALSDESGGGSPGTGFWLVAVLETTDANAAPIREALGVTGSDLIAGLVGLRAELPVPGTNDGLSNAEGLAIGAAERRARLSGRPMCPLDVLAELLGADGSMAAQVLEAVGVPRARREQAATHARTVLAALDASAVPVPRPYSIYLGMGGFGRTTKQFIGNFEGSVQYEHVLVDMGIPCSAAYGALPILPVRRLSAGAVSLLARSMGEARLAERRWIRSSDILIAALSDNTMALGRHFADVGATSTRVRNMERVQHGTNEPDDVVYRALLTLTGLPTEDAPAVPVRAEEVLAQSLLLPQSSAARICEQLGLSISTVMTRLGVTNLV